MDGERRARYAVHYRPYEVVPALQRPVSGVKGAQADLRSFYLHVLVVDAYLKVATEADANRLGTAIPEGVGPVNL
jgi:hypothetical protein